MKKKYLEKIKGSIRLYDFKMKLAVALYIFVQEESESLDVSLKKSTTLVPFPPFQVLKYLCNTTFLFGSCHQKHAMFKMSLEYTQKSKHSNLRAPAYLCM